MIRTSVIAPIKNEVQLIGYSVMSMLPNVHEIIYLVDPPFTDGTWELLHHIKDKYAHEKLTIIEDKRPGDHNMENPDFNAGCYNLCLEKATGDAIVCIHPDMIVTNKDAFLNVPEGPLSWWMNCKSFAGDVYTEITEGRNKRWKSMFARKFGLHYYGGYGDTTEDFYFSQITGNAHQHYGDVFENYPFDVAYSGIDVNHYCEMKPYSYRLKKMVKCLRTQNAMKNYKEEWLEEAASKHPRVHLQSGMSPFGYFKFEKTSDPIPEVFPKYKDEFNQFIKEPLYA